jgi:antitoxin CcdA
MASKGSSIAAVPGRCGGGVLEPQGSVRPRRATNLTVRRDLVAAARRARLNLSALLERALEEELVRVKWRQWRRENAASIAAYNRHVKKHRPFSRILLRW